MVYLVDPLVVLKVCKAGIAWCVSKYMDQVKTLPVGIHQMYTLFAIERNGIRVRHL